MVWTRRSAAERESDGATVRQAVAALALGVLLGSIGVISSQWVDGYPLLHTALRSAFSAMAITALAFASPHDLFLDVDSLPERPQEEHSVCQQKRDLCRSGTLVTGHA